MTIHTTPERQPCKTAIYTALRRRNPLAAIKAAATVPFAAWPEDAAQHEEYVGKAMRNLPEVSNDRGKDARRAEILAVVEAEHGCTTGRIRRVTGIAIERLQNDLKALRGYGQIEVRNHKNYATGRDALTKLKHEPKTSRRSNKRQDFLKKTLELLQDQTMTSTQLAKHFSVTRTTARDWMATLEGQGALERIYIEQSGNRPLAAWRAITAPHSANPGASATVGADGRGNAASGAQEAGYDD